MTTLAVPAGAVVEAAPAKLNLYLHVTGRRNDGYHLLDSLIAFADIHDTVVAAPAGGLSLATVGPFSETLAGETDDPNDNLVLRAAVALAEATGVTAGAALTLIKRLPVASGIGGGSADAAAALRALCRLWRVTPDAAALDAVALELGADVPMCLHGRAAFAGGVGELLARVPSLPDAPLVLVNPLRPVATPVVFRRREGAFSAPARFDAGRDGTAALCAALGACRNDLEPAARSVEPEIGEVLSKLATSGGCLLARMSGSGATCFGIYRDTAAAAAAAAAIAGRRSGWWVRPSRLRADIRDLDPSLAIG